MPRHRPGPTPDVFEAFADRVEEPAGQDVAGPLTVGAMARSASLTIGLMVVTGLGAIGGGWLAADHTPDIQYTNLAWEGLVLVVWCGLWGLLAGASTLAIAFVAVGLPWARRQRRAQDVGGPTSTSRP